jgi:hypothetical protein
MTIILKDGTKIADVGAKCIFIRQPADEGNEPWGAVISLADTQVAVGDLRTLADFLEANPDLTVQGARVAVES